MNLCTYRNLPVSVLLFTILVELYLAVDVSKNASYPKESRESKYEDFIFHNGKCINLMTYAIVTYCIERATTYLPQLLHVPLQISSIL